MAIQVNEEILKNLAFYGGIVLAKTLLMALATAKNRFASKTFANPEDAKSTPGSKVGSDPDVERVRRVHLNDMENVFPFIMIAILYVFTANPTVAGSLLHFRVFAIARCLHSITYLFAIPQPSRALCFFAGYIVCFSMLYQTIF